MKNLLFPSLAALALLAAPAALQADLKDRLFDFTDAYYVQNGVNPAAIGGRMQPGPVGAVDTPNFGYQRNVRALLTQPAYDASGKAWYFTVLGGLSADSFSANSAGQNARQIADTYKEYVFPRRGTDPVGLGATRQSVILDMRNGYFSHNPLGLWLHVWVSYTAKATGTSDGIKTLNDLARKNGRDLDGTPIITSVGDIEKLTQKGYVTQTSRPLSDGLRYAICPVIKDPTDGGIARDQFLAYTRNADGTALEPFFLNNFLSLQSTGRNADKVDQPEHAAPTQMKAK